jgi:hypothetical protein
VSKSVRTQVALSVALVGAAIVGGLTQPPWVIPCVLIFGLFNVFVVLEGTHWVRMFAVAAALITLVWPKTLFPVLVILGGLIWPAAYLVAFSIAHEPEREDSEPSPGPSATPARVSVAAIVAAVALASLGYRALILHDLGQTAALFLGLPSLLAIVVVFCVSPRSAIGVACKAVTVGLLVSLLFLGEGMLCVIMAAPLFYLVAVLIGIGVNLARRDRMSSGGRTLSCAGVLLLLTMSLEGVGGVTTFNRDQWVNVSRTLPYSAAAVERALFETPRFDRPLPLALRVGFPRPVRSSIESRAAGARWTIAVRGGELRFEGGRIREPRIGDLILELQRSGPGIVGWRAVSDDSHITHYLTWQEARVEWSAVGSERTRVTWRLRYRRDLDPAWYFGPLEEIAATLAASYLIDSVATP